MWIKLLSLLLLLFISQQWFSDSPSEWTLVSTLSPTNVDSFFLIPCSHFCPTQQWGKAARPINVSISHMFACAAVFISTPSRPLAFAWQSSAYCWPISRCLQLILFHTKWEFLFSCTQVAQELPLSLWELQRDSSVDSFMYLHLWRADRKGPFCRTFVVASIRDDRGLRFFFVASAICHEWTPENTPGRSLIRFDPAVWMPSRALCIWLSLAFPSRVWLTAAERGFAFPETWRVRSSSCFPSSFRRHDVSLTLPTSWK